MRLRYNLICLGICAGFACCQKSASIKDVVSIYASSTQVLADGSSLDTIYADLPINSLIADRGVTFQASSGLFVNGFDTMSVLASRINVDPGKITAVVTWTASLRSGPDTLSVSNSTTPQYTDQVILTLNPSLADSMLLIPSSYTLNDSFGMQVTVAATLFNSQGGMVSQGAMIKFSDLNDAGSTAGGMFQPLVAIADSSKVSTVYFPPMLTSGTTTGSRITINATVLNAAGAGIASGTTSIYIYP